MLLATTVVTVYASPLIPIVVGLVVAWVALLAALVAEVRLGRKVPPGPRAPVVNSLGAVLLLVSAILVYMAVRILQG